MTCVHEIQTNGLLYICQELYVRVVCTVYMYVRMYVGEIEEERKDECWHDA